MKQLLFAFLGGGLGATTRYLIGLWLKREDPGFFWATFLSNILGCLILGIIIGLRDKSGLSSAQYVLFAVGFCGALTTFSTWIFEQSQLYDFKGIAATAFYTFSSWIAGWFVFIIGGYLARGWA